MKTLVDFKRKLTKGSKWHTYYHLANKDLGVRPVHRVRSRSVSFLVTKDDRGTHESWLTLPKAKDLKFVDENTVKVYEGDTLVLTYKFIEAGD